jgi:hypothetical protein
MDFKLNTLHYLTEPTLLEKINNDGKNDSQKNEIDFYKKRIFLTTKQLLRNKKLNSSVNNAFNNYARILIQHFKIVDTNDILQEEFKNMQEQTVQSNYEFKSESEIENAANSYIIAEQKDENEGTLNNFVKTIHTKSEEKMIMPKQRTVNLKNPTLRNKGINNNKNNNNK